jgi:tetratricopeptide (TPR) repeat protein
MSYPELKQLTRVEEFFDAGKLDDAFQVLTNNVKFKELNTQQKDYFHLIKGLILTYQNKSDELIEFGEQILKEGQDLNDNLKTVDGLFFIITGLGLAEKFKEALEKIESGKRFISNISKDVFIRRNARMSILKGWINLEMVKIDVAEKSFNWVINLQNKIGNTFEIVWANLMMARLMIQGKNRLDLAIKFNKEALKLAEEIKFNHYWIALSYLSLGVIHVFRGEIDISLDYNKKSLEIYRRINNNKYIALVLNNIGINYFQMGNFNLSLKAFEESLLYYEPQSIGTEVPLSNLVEVALESGDNDLAQKYFNRLKNLYIQKKEGLIELIYQFTRALLLKKSSRIRDKAKAEKILKRIIDTKTIWSEIGINAIIHLCDLLLSEYQFTNNNEVFDELNHYLARLLTIAEKTNSYIYFCKTFILKSKLALISWDFKTARRFLNQAQKTAESYGIKRLAMKISYEHDEFIKQLQLWESLKESKAPLTERWELAGLNEQMENMVKKRMIEPPKLSDEEPVLLLIVSEGGVPFFTQSFLEDKSFEDHLLGGFFTAINSFIHEMFSEGFNRAAFGKHTLLMNSLSPFLVFYIYTGQSYSAQNRIKSFIKEIKSHREVWDTFEKFYQANRKIQINDIPPLESLIKEIFIEKTIQ